jgi:hypothetical protein
MFRAAATLDRTAWPDSLYAICGWAFAIHFSTVCRNSSTVLRISVASVPLTSQAVL